MQSREHAVRYRVDLTDRVHHLVRVTLSVPADLVPAARLVLSVWTPGSYLVRNYARHVQSVTAVADATGPIRVVGDGIGAWRLSDDLDAQTVDVTFELYANDLTVRTNHVDDHHALLIPAATFAYIEGGEDREHLVHVPTQPGEKVWSLLPASDEADTFVADNRDHLIDSAFEVGVLPSIEFLVGDTEHTFVWAGHGGTPDLPKIAEDTAAIARECTRLFDTAIPADQYTLLTVGWDQGGGGLEHRDGAVLQMPVDTFQDPDLTARFQSLVAHEYLHQWNVKRLTPSALVRPAYDRPTQSESLWVAEGWTAYYDELLPTRAGLWSTSRLLRSLATGYMRLRDTPGAGRQSLREASYEAWIKHYLRDENAPNAMTDYYGHGALVAFELDLRLRAANPDGDGLDEIFRLLWQRHANTDAGYDESDVIDAIGTVGGEEMAALAENRVATPRWPELTDAVAAVGLTWRESQGPHAPYLGLSVRAPGRATHEVVASVLRDGPAWQAGITGEDVLLAIDGRTFAPGKLNTLLRAFSPGEHVSITVQRGPRLLMLPVTLAAPVPPLELAADPRASRAQRMAFERWSGQPLPTEEAD